MKEFKTVDINSEVMTVENLTPGDEYSVIVRPMHGKLRGPEFEYRQIIREQQLSKNLQMLNSLIMFSKTSSKYY